MIAESPDSSFTWSNYSISEDDAYVYCRVTVSPNEGQGEQSPIPTLETWRSCRDSGFVENMQPISRIQSDKLAESIANYEDHEYYNLLPSPKCEEDHDYTYPAFAVENTFGVNIRKPRREVSLRRTRRRFQRYERQMSTLSTKSVINAARPYHPEERNTPTHLPSTYKGRITPKRNCYVDCKDEGVHNLGRSEEIKAVYENLRKAKDNEAIKLYGHLVIIAMEELRGEPDGVERIAAFQRKIEKTLHLRTGLDLSAANCDFRKSAEIFESLIEQRLRAINDVSPSSCQKITDKLCLVQSAARQHKTSFIHLNAIRKGIRKLFGFL